MIIVESVQAQGLQITKRVNQNVDLDAIDSALVQSLAGKVTAMQEVKTAIIHALSNPNLVSDPAALMRVQAMLADYSLNIDLATKVANKMVTGIDTLVKS